MIPNTEYLTIILEGMKATTHALYISKSALAKKLHAHYQICISFEATTSYEILNLPK